MRGAEAVEPRTTSSGWKTNSLWGAGVPPTSSRRARTAACPMAVTGCRIVVSGGSVKAMRGVVEADHGDVVGDVEPALAGRADRAERHHVAGADDGRGAPLDQRARRGLAALQCVEGVLDERLRLGRGGLQPLLHGADEALDLALYGHEALGAEGQPDPPVAERAEVGDRQVHRGAVVGGDEGRLDLVGEAVDEDERDALAAQLLIALHIGGGVRVQPGDEDDAGHPAVHQHLGQLVLRGAAGCLGREDGRIALAGQRLPDDLGEGREDRVLQLRGDQPDQPGAALPQPHRALVAQHIEGGEHGLAGGGGDTGLPVENPADGGLADTRLCCDIGEPGGHGWDCTVRLSDCPPGAAVAGEHGGGSVAGQRGAGQQQRTGRRQFHLVTQRVDGAQQAGAGEGEHPVRCGGPAHLSVAQSRQSAP